MRYENPQIPEDINVTDEHPLKEVAWLLSAALALFALVLIVLSLSAGFLARLVPFEFERSLAAPFESALPVDTTDQNAREQYLQDLSERVIEHAQLPQQMRVRVQLVESDELNAFATIGGNVVIFSALFDSLTSENALAMVVAHEIAHVKHRDPISAMGRVVAFQLVLASLFGNTGTDALNVTMGQAGLLTLLKFSRSQETAADEEALRILKAMYGHVSGADELFQAMLEKNGEGPPALFSTHPGSEQRIERIKTCEAHDGGSGELSALPDFTSGGTTP